jgi:hypothetical protein
MITYAMPDTIYEIPDDENDDPQWNHDHDADVLAAIRDRMTARGFTAVDFDGPDERDVVILVFGFTGRFWSVGTWYPWYPGWGGWYPWYPPVTPVYEYTTGTLSVQMVEPAAAAADTVDVWWLGGANGVAGSSAGANRTRLVRAVRQMFAQSPYLAAGADKGVGHD